jgi:hypothetical protein
MHVQLPTLFWGVLVFLAPLLPSEPFPAVTAHRRCGACHGRQTGVRICICQLARLQLALPVPVLKLSYTNLTGKSSMSHECLYNLYAQHQAATLQDATTPPPSSRLKLSQLSAVHARLQH